MRAAMSHSILILDILYQIIEAAKEVKNKCKYAKCIEDFCDTEIGQEKLDSICIKLIAIEESLKNIDKITDKKLLIKYPQVNWKKIKGIRDFISHHYFDIDAEIIYSICNKHIDGVIETLNLIQKDIKNDKKI